MQDIYLCLLVSRIYAMQSVSQQTIDNYSPFALITWPTIQNLFRFRVYYDAAACTYCCKISVYIILCVECVVGLFSFLLISLGFASYSFRLIHKIQIKCVQMHYQYANACNFSVQMGCFRQKCRNLANLWTASVTEARTFTLFACIRECVIKIHVAHIYIWPLANCNKMMKTHWTIVFG